MLTLCIAAAVLAACTALRWFLNRPERKDEAFWNGRIRLTALWNEGAAFSLPMKRTLVAALSILILPLVWVLPPEPYRRGTGPGRRSQQFVGAAATWPGLRLCAVPQAAEAGPLRLEPGGFRHSAGRTAAGPV